MRESRILKRDVNGEMDAGEGREMGGEGRGLLEEEEEEIALGETGQRRGEGEER